VSGAYPDGCTAADIPGCEPEPHYVDEDAAYDDLRQRVDDGAQCPTCLTHSGITSETNIGIKCYACTCGERWVAGVSVL
jgi:hypothetical protein